MKNAEEILFEMDTLLDQLIQNAQRLKEISAQTVSEHELEVLQNKQEELITKLLKLDSEFNKVSNSSIASSPTSKKIEQKLKDFQLINQNFIENISTTPGLIRFDFHKASKHTKS